MYMFQILLLRGVVLLIFFIELLEYIKLFVNLVGKRCHSKFYSKIIVMSIIWIAIKQLFDNFHSFDRVVKL